MITLSNPSNSDSGIRLRGPDPCVVTGESVRSCRQSVPAALGRRVRIYVDLVVLSNLS